MINVEATLSVYLFVTFSPLFHLIIVKLGMKKDRGRRNKHQKRTKVNFFNL